MATQIKDHEHVCYLCGQTWEHPAHASEQGLEAEEARDKIRAFLNKPYVEGYDAVLGFIQSAIEKTLSEKEALWIKHAKQYTDEIASLRAAHASENMAPTNQVCPKCGNVGCLTHAHASEAWTEETVKVMLENPAGFKSGEAAVAAVHNSALKRQPAHASEGQLYRKLGKGEQPQKGDLTIGSDIGPYIRPIAAHE